MENHEKTPTIHTQMIAFQEQNISIPRKGKGTINGREYNYATLDDVINIVKPVLNKLGLYIAQVLDNGNLVTNIVHGDTQAAIRSTIPVGTPSSAQDLGSRITYFRRYALIAMLGLTTEDDVDAVGSVTAASAQKDPAVASAPIQQPVSVAETTDALKEPEPARTDTIPNIEDLKKPRPAVVQAIDPVQPAPAPTTPAPEVERPVSAAIAQETSAAMNKAIGAIDSCQNELALKEIIRFITASVKITDAEKADLMVRADNKLKEINAGTNA